MIENNPVLFTPIRDDHAIEIMLAGFCFKQCEAYEFLSYWVEQITHSSIFSHRVKGGYPCVFRDYVDLIEHPQNKEDYQVNATIGSVLYPTLAAWLAILNRSETFNYLAEFQCEDMAHSTWQLWLPDDITEEHFYTNSAAHGSCLSGLDIQQGPEVLLDQVVNEIKASRAFIDLSAIRLNVWPIVLMACRSYRLPVPPHFWAMQILPSEIA